MAIDSEEDLLSQSQRIRLKARCALSLALVGLGSLFPLLAPRNPEYDFPLIPELLLLSSLFAAFAVLPIRWGALLPHKSERAERVLFCSYWAILLFVMLPLAILSVFTLSDSSHWIPCTSLAPLGLQIECFLQASTSHQAGFRHFLQSFTALLAATLVLFIGKSWPQSQSVRSHTLPSKNLLWLPVLLGPLLLCFLGFVDMLSPEPLLPSWLTYSSESNRFTTLIANPGWVWPYLAPALVLSLAFILQPPEKTKHTALFRLSFLLLFLFLAAGAMATQQRGALLLLGALVFSAGCVAAFARSASRISKLLGRIIVAFSAAAAVLLVMFPGLIQDMARCIGYDWKVLGVQSDRYEIWRLGWYLFKEEPLWGHGYASWFRIASEAQALFPKAPLFDTSHNLYIQLLVEHGLIVFLLVIGTLVSSAALLIRRGNGFALGLGVLLTTSFLCCTLVQEISYVRPVFYVHAITLGLALSLTATQQSSVPAEPEKHRARTAPFVAFGLAGVSAALFLSAALLFQVFSFDAFAFEADSRRPSQSIYRWIGPAARVSAYRNPLDRKHYSIFGIAGRDPKNTAYKLLSPSNLELDVNLGESQAMEVPLFNGGANIPMKNAIHFGVVINESTRLLSAQLLYPPVQTNLAIYWSTGLYGRENFQGRMGYWCSESCQLVAATCSSHDVLKLHFFAPRPASQESPVDVDIQVSFIDPRNIGTTPQSDHSDFSSPISFTSPNERRELSVQIPSGKIPLMRIKPKSLFLPHLSNGSSDGRSLGIVLMEPDC
jgi:hypothetical protein